MAGEGQPSHTKTTMPGTASSLPLLPVLLPSEPATLHPLPSQTSGADWGTGSGQHGFAGLVAVCSTLGMLGGKGAALATMQHDAAHKQPVAHGLGQRTVWENRSQTRSRGQQGWGRQSLSAQTSLVQQLLAEVSRAALGH